MVFMEKLAGIMFICCAATALFATEPLIEFKLNEGVGATVKDISGKYAGTVYFPENTKWGPGRLEDTDALYFAGVPDKTRKGGGVILPVGKQVDFSKPFTLMFYFYLDKSLPRVSTKEMASCTHSENGSGFRTIFSWNRICFWIGNGKKRTELNTNSNKVKVLRGVWQHLSITVDNGRAAIYLNGIKTAERDNMMPIRDYPDVLSVGSYQSGYTYNFNGAISDVKIFDRALSDREILAMVKGIE